MFRLLQQRFIVYRQDLQGQLPMQLPGQLQQQLPEGGEAPSEKSAGDDAGGLLDMVRGYLRLRPHD